MKNIFLICLLLVCSSPFSAMADDSDWMYFGDTDSREWHIRKGSFDIETTKGGDVVASVLTQVKQKNTKQIQFQKWYVSQSDCDKGYGKFVVLTVNNEFVTENDFISGGKSVAANGADFICSLYKGIKNSQENKEI